MISLDIEATEIVFQETNSKDSVDTRFEITEQTILVSGRPKLRSVSPDRSLLLRKNGKELSVPINSTVTITPKEDSESNSRFWGKIFYVEAFDDDSVYSGVNSQDSLEVTLHCTPVVFEELKGMFQLDSIRIGISAYFYGQSAWGDDWDVKKTNDQDAAGSLSLKNVVITTHKSVGPESNAKALSWLGKQRNSVAEFQDSLEKSIFQASLLEALGALLVGLVAFGILQIFKVSVITSLVSGVLAFFVYSFRYIFYLLMIVERAILWTKDDLNNNATFLKMKEEDIE